MRDFDYVSGPSQRKPAGVDGGSQTAKKWEFSVIKYERAYVSPYECASEILKNILFQR